MKRIIRSSNSFYETLSDITLATLGIFIIFLIINIIFMNTEQIQAAAKNKELEKKIIIQKELFNSIKNADLDELEEVKQQQKYEINKITQELDKIRSQQNNLQNKIAEAQKNIQHQMNSDEIITLEEIKRILREVKLKRKKEQKKIDRIKLKSNNIRQEFNVYLEIESSYPYMEIKDSYPNISISGINITQAQFRSILQEINAGSGFRFKMQKQYIDREYKRPVAPKWIQDILVSEGWFKIKDEV